jgi:hypothetical protein
MEGQLIQFYKNEVTLEVYLNDDLKSQNDTSGIFSSFIIDTGMIDCKPKYWDNIDFFLKRNKHVIKKECKADVVELGLKWKDVYADVKYLIKKAKRLGYITDAPRESVPQNPF